MAGGNKKKNEESTTTRSAKDTSMKAPTKNNVNLTAVGHKESK